MKGKVLYTLINPSLICISVISYILVMQKQKLSWPDNSGRKISVGMAAFPSALIFHSVPKETILAML